MTERDKEIGETLIVLRGERSQKEVATLMKNRGWKWSQATVWSVEQGERALRLGEAVDLASIFGVSVIHLTGTSRLARVVTRQKDVGLKFAVLRDALLAYRDAQYRLAIAADAAVRAGDELPFAGMPVEELIRANLEDVVQKVRIEIDVTKEKNERLRAAQARIRGEAFDEKFPDAPRLRPEMPHPSPYVDIFLRMESEAEAAGTVEKEPADGLNPEAP